MQNVMSIDRIYEESSFFSRVRKFQALVAEHIIFQKDNIFLWTPVFFAFGIGLYFSLPFEPPSVLVALIFIMTVAMYYLGRVNKLYSLPLLALLILVSGFSAAKIRTDYVATKIIEKKISFANIVGNIETIEQMEEGAGSRIILSELDIEGISKNKTPKKIRLRIRKDTNIEIGQRVKILAALNPPSEPLIPNGFDFRRYLYFQEIGAVGFVYNEPEILHYPQSPFLNIEKTRHYIASKLYDYLPSDTASIAAALLVGQKNAITDENKQAVRDAGLAHMLAISGLHVGLFSGTLFFIMRFALAFFPNIALRYPVKKIAAIFALIGAIFYMLLAGSTIPTQRAVLMISIVFLAIIIDRSPISLRLVAASALIVLLFRPESLLSVSFQMSFAAVTCLVYFYEITRPMWIKLYANSNMLKKAVSYFLAVCITTVIASIATAPFALYHFGQVSFVGSVANLVAVPLLTFIIMPFALLSLILMPLGLAYVPVSIMGWGIDAMLEIAYWAADLPHAILLSPMWPFVSFVIMTLAVLFIILWKGVGKILAIPFIVWSLFLIQTNLMPDILVSSSHRLFLFRLDNDQIYVSSRKNDRFVLKNWERLYGLPEKDAITLPYKGEGNVKGGQYNCGEQGCRFNINGYKVSFSRQPYISEQECSWADILIASDPVKVRECNSRHIIDKFDTWKYGVHALWLDFNGVTVKNVAQTTANRPWSKYKTASDRI